jgi:hypothetical protein
MKVEINKSDLKSRVRWNYIITVITLIAIWGFYSAKLHWGFYVLIGVMVLEILVTTFSAVLMDNPVVHDKLLDDPRAAKNIFYIIASNDLHTYITSAVVMIFTLGLNLYWICLAQWVLLGSEIFYKSKVRQHFQVKQ